MGDAEEIHTVVRKGLKEDQPEAYKVLDKFHWTEKDMEKVMLEINNGKEPQQAAQDWIKENQKTVDSWKE